jgi:hypothetical protein
MLASVHPRQVLVKPRTRPIDASWKKASSLFGGSFCASEQADLARRTHVAVGGRGAVAVKSTTVVRPVRPWVQQPYYGAVFDGVTLGAVIAANAVPTSRSIDVCWYWSNSSKTRGYWDFCQ